MIQCQRRPDRINTDDKSTTRSGGGHFTLPPNRAHTARRETQDATVEICRSAGWMIAGGCGLSQIAARILSIASSAQT